MNDPVSVLKQYWGYAQFRPLQEDIVRAVLDEKDVLALLPTGGGKSVCFQVPGLMREGICLVISPLIALMKDQVEQLKRRNIPAAGVYSGMSRREIDIVLDNAANGAYKFLYLSPERLKTELFQERATKMNIGLLAIDEAHCISQWGYDFRPPYLEISAFREKYPDVPCIALTATATEPVKLDIQDKLAFREANVFQKSFARDNLSYSVRKVENKEAKLVEVLEKIGGSSVVYCSSRKRTIEIAEMLQMHHLSADFYHAGLSHEQRNRKQDDWISNKTRVMVATNAFGMGIDKPDVRTVIHWDMPDNLEAYYQEAGRAGRDEKKAFAVALFHENDLVEMEKRIEQSNPELPYLKKIYQCLANYYKIAIGAGAMLSYPFGIADFVKTFDLQAFEAFQALKKLEEEGFVQLNEQFYRPSGLHFNVNYKAIYEYEIAHEKYEPLLKSLLRIYGGELYNQVVYIQEAKIAQVAGISVSEVKKQLEFLQKEQLLDYTAQSDLPQITFLTPRYDANKLPVNQKRIAERRALSLDKARAVNAYLTNEVLCRTLSLLSYFGEDKEEPCGVCDVCLAGRKSKEGMVTDGLKGKIIQQFTTTDALSIETLQQQLPDYAKELVVDAIRTLNEEGALELDMYGAVRKVQ